MPEKEPQANVPFFVHEAMMNKMDISNKRMLIALVVVCITLIITVSCFLSAYKTMNKTWMEFYAERQTTTEETDDARVHEFGDQGAD